MLLQRLARPFRPPFETARHYNLRKFRRDIIAGLTVSVVEVPQSMAYALIAGVPPQYGLYTSIIQGVVGALLSSSEHITTGPTNTQSLLIASAVARIAGADGSFYLQLVFMLTMLKGLLQLSFAAAQLGDMVRYVSRSVIVGVAAGAGVLILAGQLANFFGIPTVSTRHFPGVVGSIERMLPHIREVNWYAIGLGAMCIAITYGARFISPFAPGALVSIIASAAIVYLLGWDHRVAVVGALPRERPHFQVPWVSWEMAEALFGGALALAILGMLESVAIAKAIAAHTGERISANQEFFAQGLKNFITSFFQCIPGSASFTRSALDYAAGAETRFAAVYNAMFVGVIFFVGAGAAAYIPLASLAAVLIVIAIKLIDWKYFVRIARTHRGDAVVLIATFLATMFAPLEYAIFIGIFLNLALYVHTASKLHMSEMISTPGGRFIERPLSDRAGREAVIFLQVEGNLFFGLADELQDRLSALTRSNVRVVILRLKRTLSIDSTVLHVLDQFTRDMHERHAFVVLCGVRPELMRALKNYGMIDLLGRDNVFQTTEGVFASAKQAILRARELVGRSIDSKSIEVDIQEEALTYEI
jgi:SulP family sulfate permease